MPAGFSDEEILAVNEQYPRLEKIAPDIVEGILDVNASFEGVVLSDAFQVRITVANLHSDRLPALFETGGRIQAIARKYGLIDLRDLHRNPGDGSACVCVKQEEDKKYPPNSNLSIFIENLAVPYFMVCYGTRKMGNGRGGNTATVFSAHWSFLLTASTSRREKIFSLSRGVYEMTYVENDI